MQKSTLISLFREMFKIRAVEEHIAKNYFPEGREQEMRCPTHLSIGQEAAAVGVIAQLRKSDWLFGTHRSHATYIAKGGSITKMFAELMGKKTGCLNGRGGSMHLKDLDVNYVMSVPIVGSVLPLAVGFALGAKIDKSNQVSVVFFGDGAMEEGAWHEAANFAALNSLPVLFVCENNLFSVYSHVDIRQPNNEMCCHAISHGIKTFKADGNDVEEVFKVAGSAIKAVRGSGPCFLELFTYRHLEHCGPNEDDHLGYRPPSELKEWLARDPISQMRKKLLGSKTVDPNEIIAIEEEMRLMASKAFKDAQLAEFPSFADVENLEYPVA